MKVERGDRMMLGSCNFCKRGELVPSLSLMTYPYNEVTTFCDERGGGLKASICDDCLEELYAKTKFAQL